MVMFLLSPALILGGTFYVASGSIIKGVALLAFFAVVTGAALAVGAVATEAGERSRHRRLQRESQLPKAQARVAEKPR